MKTKPSTKGSAKKSDDDTSSNAAFSCCHAKRRNKCDSGNNGLSKAEQNINRMHENIKLEFIKDNKSMIPAKTTQTLTTTTA